MQHVCDRLVHFFRSSPSEVFLGKSILKIWSKFTGEHPCRSVISIKLQSKLHFTFLHGCSPVNLLHIFRTTFYKNTFGWLFPKSSVAAKDKKWLRIHDFMYFTVLGDETWNFIKKKFQHRCFSVNIAKFLRKAFSIEHLQWLLLLRVEENTSN